MKPRFSILALLGITAYVAVTVGGIVSTNSIWNYANQGVWIATVAWGIIVASGKDSAGAAFGRGFTLSCLACLAFASFHYAVWDHQRSRFIFSGVPFADFIRVAILHDSIIVGLAGGCLALGRYRRLERREQREKAG